RPWRRVDHPAGARAQIKTPAARADLRRQRIDGALRADAAPLHSQPRRRLRSRRSVSLLDAADARHARAHASRLDGAAEASAARARLRRRDTDRRSAADVQRPLGAARARSRSGRPADFRWMGSRRARSVAARDEPPAAQLSPLDLAEPAAGLTRLSAADARHAGGASVRRRFSAGAQPREPRRARRASQLATFTAARARETALDARGWNMASARRTTSAGGSYRASPAAMGANRCSVPTNSPQRAQPADKCCYIADRWASSPRPRTKSAHSGTS